MSELDKEVKKFMESEPLNFTKEGGFYIDRTRKITDPAVERIVVPEGKVLAVSLTLPEEVAKNFYVAQQRAVLKAKKDENDKVLKQWVWQAAEDMSDDDFINWCVDRQSKFDRQLKELEEEL